MEKCKQQNLSERAGQSRARMIENVGLYRAEIPDGDCPTRSDCFRPGAQVFLRVAALKFVGSRATRTRFANPAVGGYDLGGDEQRNDGGHVNSRVFVSVTVSDKSTTTCFSLSFFLTVAHLARPANFCVKGPLVAM